MRELEKEALLKDLADVYSDALLLLNDHGHNIEECFADEDECSNDEDISRIVQMMKEWRDILGDHA